MKVSVYIELGGFIRIANTGMILCMHRANARRRYNVTSSLIGSVHTQNDPCE